MSRDPSHDPTTRSRTLIVVAVVTVLAPICVCMCQPFSSASATTTADDGGVKDGAPSTVLADATNGGDGNIVNGSWCSANASSDAFCADFEGVSNVASGWTSTRLVGDGVLDLSTSLATSPSHSARMTMTGALAGTDAGAECRFSELIYTSTKLDTKGHLAFDVWISNKTTTTIARFGGNCAIDLQVGDTSGVGVELDRNGTDGGSQDFAIPIPRQQWIRVTIDFDFGVAGASYTASHSADPKPITQRMDDRCKANDHISLDLGDHCPDNTGDASEVYFDNVVMTPR